MPKQVKIENELINFVSGARTAGALPAREREAPPGEAIMAVGPDNLLLRALSEIRVALDGRGERFDRIEKNLDNVSESAAFVPDAAVHAAVRLEGVQKRLDAHDRRIDGLEERV